MWLIDIMQWCEKQNNRSFSLKDIYQAEDDFKRKHENNKNIHAKIRQQLQILRDKNYLCFEGKENYRLLD